MTFWKVEMTDMELAGFTSEQNIPFMKGRKQFWTSVESSQRLSGEVYERQEAVFDVRGSVQTSLERGLGT